MSLYNLIPNDGSLWSIRAVDISGNYNQKLNFDASGNAIIRTGNTDRLTINSSGAWTCQGGLTYNNTSNTLTATTFSGDLSGNATTSTNISGGAGGQVLYQSASGTTAKLANGTSGQVLTSAGTTLAPTWTTPSGAAGFSYTADTTTTSPPSSNGQITWNNATQSSSTILNISTYDKFGNFIRSYFSSIYPIGTILRLVQTNNPANYQIWETTFIGTSGIVYADVGVILRNASSFYSFSNNDSIQLVIDEVGAPPQSLSEVLTTGNSAGATNIDMNTQNITNATSITSTTFVGALTGNASTATNISGGAGGQVLYQSASGTTAKLANGTSGQVLTSAGTTLAPTWTTVFTSSAPKVFNFTASGTYTPTAGTKYIKIQNQAPGCGGGASSTSGTASGGTSGGNVVFGNATAWALTATGGNLGGVNALGSGASALNTINATYYTGFAVQGGCGQGSLGVTSGILSVAIVCAGGQGGGSFMGGNGGGAGGTNSPWNGIAGTSYGGGGGGAGVYSGVANIFSGSGGSGGNYVEAYMNNPLGIFASTAISIGAAGTGQTGTVGAGGAGGPGIIIITEFFNY